MKNNKWYLILSFGLITGYLYGQKHHGITPIFIMLIFVIVESYVVAWLSRFVVKMKDKIQKEREKVRQQI